MGTLVTRLSTRATHGIKLYQFLDSGIQIFLKLFWLKPSLAKDVSTLRSFFFFFFFFFFKFMVL